MNYKIVPLLMMLGIVLAVMVGCARVQVVPKDMQGQVNRDITFSQLLDNPVQYQGQLLVLGGQVLSAKRLKEATQIEVLHLPLSRDLKPVESLQESERPVFGVSKGFFGSCDSSSGDPRNGGWRGFRPGNVAVG
jgi:outer membrane lipoprotein